MATRELAYRLLQQTYYDSVDRGDMDAAASALHEDIEWSHAQVWAHHDFQRGEPSMKRGREAVRAYLAARKEKLAEARIQHKVRDLVVDGNRGAMLGFRARSRWIREAIHGVVRDTRREDRSLSAATRLSVTGAGVTRVPNASRSGAERFAAASGKGYALEG